MNPIHELGLPDDLCRRLEDLEFRHGARAGRLALAMELLTDAQCLGGQHHLYPTVQGRGGRQPRDLEQVLAQLGASKALVQSVFLDLAGRR